MNYGQIEATYKNMQNVNFIDKCLKVFYFFLLNCFNCELNSGGSILSQINQSKASTSQFLNKVVLIFDIAFIGRLKHFLVILLIGHLAINIFHVLRYKLIL